VSISVDCSITRFYLQLQVQTLIIMTVFSDGRIKCQWDRHVLKTEIGL